MYGQSSLRIHHLHLPSPDPAPTLPQPYPLRAKGEGRREKGEGRRAKGKVRNYFKHVLNLFKPYLSETFKLKEKTFKDNRTNNTYKSVNFATLSLPCFNQYKSLFYKNNKKIVPINIQELLTPIGLAYWIMDDGSIQNKGLHLNTYAFNSEDVLKLKSTLENMFGNNSLKCSIHKHKKGDRIYIFGESMDILRNNISVYMHEDMLYKLNSSLHRAGPGGAGPGRA